MATEIILQSKIFLQFPREGELDEYDRPTTKHEAEKFVALDSASGGYPYGTSIDRAHDFKTVEAAERYRGSMNHLKIRQVQIRYTFEKA